MAHVLIVEDSPDQARMIAGLLESAGHTAEITGDGQDALAAIAIRAPDVVATDLVLPGLNGLQLVEAIREAHPLIPVILMTAFGSGAIAVQALKKGAASYVPKRRLRDELLDTVETTLSLAREERDRERVIDRLVDLDLRFVLENDQSLVAPLVGYIQKRIDGRLRGFDENQLMQVGIAMQEALLNAMHHGNLEVSSELRADDTDSYRKTIEQRMQDPAYNHRRVELTAKITQSDLTCTVCDEGPGFDPAEVPDPTDAANLESVSGRGLYLIHTFMDRVSHNDRGNEITLVKRLVS